MDWKTFLALAMAVFTNLKDLIPLPNIHDGLAMRVWLRALVVVLKKVVEMTPIRLDDEAVALLDRVVSSDDTYAAFHALLVNLLTRDEAGAAVMACPCPCPDGQCPEDIRLFAEKAGFNPLLVLGIIQAVLKVIEIIKDLRTDEPVAA